MARILPAGALTRYLGPQRRYGWSVLVQDASGSYVDLTQWWQTFTWGEDQDQGAANGTLVFRREAQLGGVLRSLAPLVEGSPFNQSSGSYDPLLGTFRRLRVFAGVGAPTAGSPDPGLEVFRGVIDNPQWGGRASRVEVEVRDMAALLQDTLIPLAVEYGSEAGAPIETVMQQILTDNMGADPGDGSLTIAVLGDTEGWSLDRFTQKRGMSVWDALRALALQMSWDFRYWWHPDGSYRPTLRDPRVQDGVVSLTLSQSQFLDIPQLRLNATDVRNTGELIYWDTEAADYRTLTFQDTASVARYGVRRFGFFEDKTQIDTVTEGMQYLRGAVHDMATPYVEQTATLPFLPSLQLGDVLQFPGGTVFYDTPQQLAVTGLRHTIAADAAPTTQPSLRARPIGAFRRWLNLITDEGIPTPDPEANIPADAVLTDLTPRDSADGLTRTYSWTRGNSVATVWVFDRLEAIPVDDPWPTVTDLPTATLAHGVDQYTVNRPGQGFQRFLYLLPWYKVAGGGLRRAGPVKIIVDPPPAAFGGRLKVTVRGGVADLALEVTGSPTDFPVLAQVYEDDPDDPPDGPGPIKAVTLQAAGSLDQTTVPEFLGRGLPNRELRHWYLKLTSSTGEVRWGSPAAADRDPFATLTLTFQDFAATPQIGVSYDDDTDAVRVTVPGGRTKTWTGLTGSGLLLYIVGITLLDDGSVEDSLGVGSSRTGYAVAGQGGGEWTPAWAGGTLHGLPSSPPVARPRVVKSADGSTEDIYVILQSSAPEKVTLKFRDGDGAGAPIYTLAVSPSDPTPLYVTTGTEVGPANVLTDGVGTPTARLAAVPLVRDQLRRVYVQAVGQQSGVAGAWAPVSLSLLEQPYLESVALTFDPATGNLRLVVKGGPHTQSVAAVVDDNPDFSSPLTAFLSPLTDGGQVTATWALSGAQRGKLWSGRAIAYGLPGQTGLASVPLVDETLVPTQVDVQVEVPTNDTVRVTVTDPGHFVDPAQRVKFYVSLGDGPRTLFLPTSTPAAGVTQGAYTLTITPDPKHTTLVEPVVFLLDGTQILPGGQPLDADVQANVVNLSAATTGTTGTVTAVLDSDTVVGSGRFRYSTDNGVSWVTLAVPSSRIVAWNLALSTTGRITILAQGQNGLGQWGPTSQTDLPQYVTAGGPTLSVVPTDIGPAYQISYTPSTGIVYKRDGVTTTLPASPFSVIQNPAGGPDIVLTFSLTAGGQTIEKTIVVPAVDADTYAADVHLDPLSTTPTQLVFAGYAVNIKAPSQPAYVNATFTFLDCTGTVGGTAVAAGGSFTALANGVTVVVNRPQLGSPPGRLKIRAQLAGGAPSEENITISEQTRDFTPPVFDPTATGNSLAYTFSWATPAGGVTVYSIVDGGSPVQQWPSNLSMTVPRNSSGGAPRSVTLKAIAANGMETARSFTVPPQESTGTGGGGAPASPVVYALGINARGYAPDINVFWNHANIPSGAYFQVYYQIRGMGSYAFAGNTSPGATNYVLDDGTHGLTFDASSGAITPPTQFLQVEVRMLSASNQVLSVVSGKFDSPLP
jgi:hypothetical protein